MSEIKVVFALYHIYDRIIDDIVSRESKRVGFFETKEQCVELIRKYKNYNGFKEYPEACFKIFEYVIGKEYWRDDFLVVEKSKTNED